MQNVHLVGSAESTMRHRHQLMELHRALCGKRQFYHNIHKKLIQGYSETT